MKHIILTLILSCFCAIEGFCGINKTLLEAQSLFQNATTVDQYETAKKKFQSSRYDVGYVADEHDNAINEGVRKCEQKIYELSPRLSVNGDSGSTSISFDENGGSKTLSISTNQGIPNVYALPNWITVSSTSSTSIALQCLPNTSSTERTDWFNVTAGPRTVRVNVSQAGKSVSSTSIKTSDGKTANIESVWVEHNTMINDQNGMTVHVKFTVSGLKDKDGRASAYFYDASGNAIKDTNKKYCTNGDDPVVAASALIKPSYDNTQYDDLKILIPYNELHQSGTSARELRVDILIWDYSTSKHTILARMENTSFTYTPQTDSYLTVDQKTSVSTSFSGTGGSKTFYVSTDANSWSTWGIPSFCEVVNKTSTSFTLKCNPNPSASERSDYMKIKTDNHEVRIDITQSAGSGAKINRIWVDHNIFHGGQKGMMIHIDFEVNGLKNHTINPVAYFEFSNGSRIKDYDGYYGTSDGQVAVGDTGFATYDGTQWKDFRLFMPYEQLHMAAGSYSLQFQIQIHDKTTGRNLISSDNQGFTVSK